MSEQIRDRQIKSLERNARRLRFHRFLTFSRLVMPSTMAFLIVPCCVYMERQWTEHTQNKL